MKMYALYANMIYGEHSVGWTLPTRLAYMILGWIIWEPIRSGFISY